MGRSMRFITALTISGPTMPWAVNEIYNCFNYFRTNNVMGGSMRVRTALTISGPTMPWADQ